MDDASTPVQTAQLKGQTELTLVDGPDDSGDTLDQFFTIKFILDGEDDLAGAAEKCREFADHLDDLVREGFELTGPVDGGVGYYGKP